MKTKDIARQYGLNLAAFETWLKSSNVSFKSSVLGGLDVDDAQNISGVVDDFKSHQETARRAAEKAEAARRAEATVKQEALSSMLITSGFNFDGFTITKYSGYISGDDAVQIARGAGGFFGGTVTNVGDSLLAALVQIRRNALVELKEAAYALGCNAVIGVDFDYLVLDPETAGSNGGTLYLPYVFGVTANGNAVVIERNGASAPVAQDVPVTVFATAQVVPEQVATAAATPPPYVPESTSASMPASWQPDPTGEHSLRWWDGLGWTEHTQD
jgi:uncharacterized protein YbjQ (UPF0145 family)